MALVSKIICYYGFDPDKPKEFSVILEGGLSNDPDATITDPSTDVPVSANDWSFTMGWACAQIITASAQVFRWTLQVANLTGIVSWSSPVDIPVSTVFLGLGGAYGSGPAGRKIYYHGTTALGTNTRTPFVNLGVNNLDLQARFLLNQTVTSRLYRLIQLYGSTQTYSVTLDAGPGKHFTPIVEYSLLGIHT